MNMQLSLLYILSENIRDLEKQIAIKEQSVEEILKPMFDEQHSLAHSIIKEPEFEGIEKLTWRNPAWSLCSMGQYGEKYSFENGTAYLESQYSDGEQTSCTLLDGFIEMDSDERAELVRNFYRSIQNEKKSDEEKARQKKIEEAKEVLRKAGIVAV